MISEVERRDRRRRRTTWILTSFVIAGCLAFLVVAAVVGNSWWAQDDPSPAADQQASNGTSVFSPAGVDFFTRQGVARVDVRPDALTATEMGFDADGAQQVTTRVPVRVEIVAPDGELTIGLVSDMTFETADDRLRTVRVVSGASGGWSRAMNGLAHTAALWGWPDGEVGRVRSEITSAATAGVDAATAALPRLEAAGVTVSAEIEFRAERALTTVTYVIEP